MSKKPGIFITLEGIDGAGKSLQAAALSEKLSKIDWFYPIKSVHEPSDSKIGSLVREILSDPDQTINPKSEVFLFMADRYEHYLNAIEPWLQKGGMVICDRFLDSTLAYQGFATHHDLRWLKDWAGQNLRSPDLTFWLDLPVKDALKRIQTRNDRQQSHNSYYEHEHLLNSVVKGYEKLSSQEPQRIKRVKADRASSLITDYLIEKIMEYHEQVMRAV